jgi:hypothetical protein
MTFKTIYKIWWVVFAGCFAWGMWLNLYLMFNVRTDGWGGVWIVARQMAMTVSSFPCILVFLAVYISGLLIMREAKRNPAEFPEAAQLFYLLSFSFTYFWVGVLYFRVIAR